jgi:hypothetical protein
VREELARMGDDDMDEDEVRETPFWSRCIATKNDRFTKTGSGQTYKKLRQKEMRFLQEASAKRVADLQSQLNELEQLSERFNDDVSVAANICV